MNEAFKRVRNASTNSHLEVLYSVLELPCCHTEELEEKRMNKAKFRLKTWAESARFLGLTQPTFNKIL